MSRPVSRASIIGSIVKKDLKEYSRDRLWMFLTLLVLIFMIVIFWVLARPGGRIDPGRDLRIRRPSGLDGSGNH